MNRSEFESNAQAAKTFQGLGSDSPLDAEFWSGYQRGLRRNYHGEKFGTAEEHKLWISSADSPDETRKMRGLGYRAGFDGQNIQQAMKTLAYNELKPMIEKILLAPEIDKKGR